MDYNRETIVDIENRSKELASDFVKHAAFNFNNLKQFVSDGLYKDLSDSVNRGGMLQLLRSGAGDMARQTAVGAGAGGLIGAGIGGLSGAIKGYKNTAGPKADRLRAAWNNGWRGGVKGGLVGGGLGAGVGAASGLDNAAGNYITKAKNAVRDFNKSDAKLKHDQVTDIVKTYIRNKDEAGTVLEDAMTNHLNFLSNSGRDFSSLIKDFKEKKAPKLRQMLADDQITPNNLKDALSENLGRYYFYDMDVKHHLSPNWDKNALTPLQKLTNNIEKITSANNQLNSLPLLDIQSAYDKALSNPFLSKTYGNIKRW